MSGYKKQTKNIELFEITWAKSPIKVLGIYLSYDSDAAVKCNFNDKVDKFIRKCHWWKARNLTIYVNIAVVKKLGISKFSLLAQTIHVQQEIV